MIEIKYNFYNTLRRNYITWEESNGGLRMCAFYTHEHLKFLPYSGVKDKNRKEVFVGHVVRVNYHGFLTFNAVVKFGEYIQDGSGGEYTGAKCIGFYAEAINRVDEYENKVIYDHLETTSLLTFDSIEVIGNIYENPELLEVRK